jgi:hypothetical protein
VGTCLSECAHVFRIVKHVRAYRAPDHIAAQTTQSGRQRRLRCSDANDSRTQEMVGLGSPRVYETHTKLSPAGCPSFLATNE